MLLLRNLENINNVFLCCFYVKILSFKSIFFNKGDVMKEKINDNNQIYCEIALEINKQMYEEHYISYSLFKITETELLRKIKCTN